MTTTVWRINENVENLELSYASSTLTVNGTGGRALSSSNPGVVTITNSSGVIISVQVTANQGFIDDTGASEIIDNLFGTDTGVAWANILPFFVYAVLNDAQTAIAFMISRVPHTRISPAAANIGAPDDAVANDEEAFFSMENIDETLYDSNPCFSIGSFVMSKTSADDWTVSALTYRDGIGFWADGRGFTMPLNQNGAEAGTYFKKNGGTSAPVFTTNQYYFRIRRSGEVTAWMYLTGDGGTDGVGAVNTIIAAPYEMATSPSTWSWFNNPTGNVALLTNSVVGSETNYPGIAEGTTDLFLKRSIVSTSQLSNWGNGARTLAMKIRYSPPGIT